MKRNENIEAFVSTIFVLKISALQLIFNKLITQRRNTSLFLNQINGWFLFAAMLLTGWWRSDDYLRLYFMWSNYLWHDRTLLNPIPAATWQNQVFPWEKTWFFENLIYTRNFVENVWKNIFWEKERKNHRIHQPDQVPEQIHRKAEVGQIPARSVRDQGKNESCWVDQQQQSNGFWT